MRSLLQPLIAAATLTVAAAKTSQVCPAGNDGPCYSVGVAPNAASSGSGNIYLQVSAPTSYTWAAFGQGTGMTGSNIFLVYQDGAGNVTVGNRKASGHFQPSLDTSSSAAQLTLLAGSGVSGGRFVANFRCSNCNSWGSGSMNFAGTSTRWISAWKQGSAINSASKSATITQHDDTSQFQINLRQSVLDSDSNPYTTSGGSTSGSGSGSGSGTGDDSGSGSDSGNNSGGGAVIISDGNKHSIVIAAHGLIMALVFTVAYPIGAVLQAIIGKWFIHAGVQMLAWLAMFVGFGLGTYLAQELGWKYTTTHTIMGTIVVCLLAIQPVLGFMHHRHFLRNRKRGIVSYVHIWYGRALIVVGMINGGLGLQLAGAGNKLIIAYSVVAGVMGVVWVAGSAAGQMRRSREGHQQERVKVSPPIQQGNGNGQFGNGYASQGRYT